MLSDNVSQNRNPVSVKVRTDAKTFTTIALSKAVYGVGWDNSVVLTSTFDGVGSNKRQQGQLNLNEADLVALQTLPSIGSVRAQAIIDHRNSVGRFNNLDDPDAVPGIGPGTITLLRPHVRF